MSQPVGQQFGLEPRLDHTEPVRTYDSKDILTNPIKYNDPSATEFGGVAGLVQPPPHVPTAIERLHQVYQIVPEDPGNGVGSVPAPELEGEF